MPRLTLSHDCRSLAEALARHRSIVASVRGATCLSFPIYDSPSPFGHGSSVIVLQFCPWCGSHFSDAPPILDPIDSPNPIPAFHPGAGVHCCEMMNIHTSGEDLIVVHDENRGLYIRPIFDGSHKTAFLGTSGIVLTFCPWCGDILPRRETHEPMEEVVLPAGATNPRY